MTALAMRVFWVSLTTSAVLLPLLFLAGPICRRYQAKSCYLLWLLLALRLLIPVEVPLPEPAMTVEVPAVELTVLETPRREAEQSSQIQEQPTLFQPAPVRRTVSYTEILSMIWLGGFIILLAAHRINYSTLRQKMWNNSRENPEDQAVLAQLGVDAAVLRGDVDTPVTIGFLRSVIILPQKMPQEDVPMVLRHEVCHIRRRDLWYKGLFLLCACVHWFNPLVWKLAKVAGEHLELCCDEDVVAGQDAHFRKEYGQLLLRSAAAGEELTLATRFGGSDLKGRIMNLFIRKKRGAVLVCAVTCAAVLLSSLVGCEAQAADPGEKESKSHAEMMLPTGEVVVNDSAAMLEVMLNSQIGAALPEIDYADETLVVFHDYWGLAMYDRIRQGFVRVADTTSVGMNRMQGSQYTEVTVGSDLNTIRMENVPNSDGTVWYYQINEDQFVQCNAHEFRAANSGQILSDKELKGYVGFSLSGGQTNVYQTSDDKLIYLEIPEEGAVRIGDLQLVEMDRSGNVQRTILKDGERTGQEETPNTWVELLPPVENAIPTGEEVMLWPVEGEYILSALHGGRTHPVTGEVYGHNGIDIIADEGGEVLAVQSGVVQQSDFDKQYGNFVLIAHEDGTSTLYAQMKERLVKENEAVTQGQAIGTVGKTGMATGEHLHFEVYQDGKRTDPLGCYPELEVSLQMDGQSQPIKVEWPVVFNQAK